MGKRTVAYIVQQNGDLRGLFLLFRDPNAFIRQQVEGPGHEVEGTDGMDHAENREMRVVPAPSLKSAVQLVLDRKADALIFDRHSLRFYLKQNPNLAVRIAPFTLADETYGFALDPNSRLRTPMGVSILKLQQSGEAETIADMFLD